MSAHDAFIAAAAELVPALEAETAALRRFDLAALANLAETKAALAARYAEQGGILRGEIAAGRIEPQARERLKLVVARVETAAARNATALRAAGTVHRRVVDTIVKAAERRSGRTATAYGRSGRLVEPGRQSRAAAPIFTAQVA